MIAMPIVWRNFTFLGIRHLSFGIQLLVDKVLNLITESYGPGWLVPSIGNSEFVLGNAYQNEWSKQYQTLEETLYF